MIRNHSTQDTSDFALFDAVVHTPFGAVGVRLSDDQLELRELSYLPKNVSEVKAKSVLAREVVKQVKAFVKNPQHVFNLPLIEQGTAFQNKVWSEVSQIPFGDTYSYKFIGQLIGCGSPRAVGGACGANPYPLIVPCHRVVAANGIGGFASHDDGFFIAVKRWLLAHEGVEY